MSDPTQRSDDSPASRAAHKLRAAIDHFGLADAIGDVHAVDVGAAHGGFTEVLLERGARQVTAIDGGHGQLREHLRQDERVTVLEKSNFKTLPLRVAPGPFGFFTVDVSHVAARTMLRPLGLRLSVGAQGVVLVKPQFELPREMVPRGGVNQSERLCEFALKRFRKKARKLGFEVVGSQMSPVRGGSGNLELLVHCRFDGFPESVTTPG